MLSARGAKLKAALLREFHTPPVQMLTLETADLRMLKSILEKLRRNG
jgi:hypothetical protein